MVIEEFGKAVQTVGSTPTTGEGQTVAAQDQYYSLVRSTLDLYREELLSNLLGITN